MLSIALLGRLVFDVELKEVGEDKDKKVVNNRMALQAGKDKTTFIDVEAWGNTAELISKYYKKGYEILTEGHLVNKTRKKEDVEYETVGFIIDRIVFTYGNKKDNEQN